MDAPETLLGRRLSVAAALITFACAFACAFPLTAGAKAPTTKIVGGTIVPNTPSLWPYAVAVGDDYGFFCGGTLIAPHWVLTAGHCEFPESVRVGAKNIGGNAGQKIDVVGTVTHPDWDYDTSENDVQLLRLKTDVVNPQPIALATAAEDPAVGAAVKVAGWGSTDPDGDMVDDLREATVNVVSNATCASDYASEGLDVFASNLCAAFTGRDTCYGDSGGPLVTSEVGGDRLAGITDWGIGCAEVGHPGVYTRVSSFKTWIESAMQKSATFDPQYVDFEDVPVGATQSQQASVRNTGDGNLTLGNLAVDYGDDVFSIANNTCAPGSVLAPNATCTFSVVYAPTSPGYYDEEEDYYEDYSDGEIKLTSDSASGTQYLQLSGYAAGEPTSPILPPPVVLPPAKETVAPSLSQVGKAKAKGKGLRAKYKLSFTPVKHSATAPVCRSKVEIAFKAPHSSSWKSVVVYPAATGTTCVANFNVTQSKKARKKKFAVHIFSLGNDTLAPFERYLDLKLK